MGTVAPDRFGTGAALMLIWTYTKELVRHREILYMITWREIAIKYKQSIMGFMWAVLIPLVIVGAGVLVRAGMAYISGGKLQVEDVATVSLKAVPWAFVVSGIRFGTNSLIQNTNLVTKIYLPREIFPIAAVASQLVDFAVATIPLTVLLALAHVGLSLQLLWVPVLVLVLVAQVSVLSIVLSAGSLFFRDIKYLVEVALTFAIFVTPVLFEVTEFGKYQTLLLLNPVAPVLEGLTATVIHHQAPDLGWLGYSAALTVLAGMIAVAVFRRVEPYFAETV
jgi:lipopolysaccharide transport system permease protein